jgi:Tol biopolymer transport system component
MRPRAWVGIGLCSALGAAGFAATALRRDPPLPGDLKGSLVLVGGGPGRETLYLRDLPSEGLRAFVRLPDAVREPAVSPDGSRVAFTTRGRVGVASVATGETSIVTLGVDWLDSSPAWHPDGRSLAIVAARPGALAADIHWLELGSGQGQPRRAALTDTPLLGESSPSFARDATFVAFVREENLFSTEKEFGIDTIAPDGGGRETLRQGSVRYRTLAPSPDGRYLAATFSYDLQFRLAEAIGLSHSEEVHLLDARGGFVGVLARSWRSPWAEPSWGP